MAAIHRGETHRAGRREDVFRPHFQRRTLQHGHGFRIAEPAADVAEKDLAVAAARGIAVEMLVAEDVDGKGTLAGLPRQGEQDEQQIGRESCRERVCPYVWISVVAEPIK